MSAANNLWEVLDMSLARGCRIVYLISQTYLHYQQTYLHYQQTIAVISWPRPHQPGQLHHCQ